MSAASLFMRGHIGAGGGHSEGSCLLGLQSHWADHRCSVRTFLLHLDLVA